MLCKNGGGAGIFFVTNHDYMFFITNFTVKQVFEKDKNKGTCVQET
jgi:hypothetical protein